MLLTPYHAYAGVGNRDTPANILDIIPDVVRQFNEYGYVLRTNGSDIPGEAFESAAVKIELYLPWKKFNKKISPYCEPTEDAFEIAKRYHPVFDKLKESVQCLVACTSHVLLGQNLRDPVGCVVCWSPDGVEDAASCTFRTGISSQAIKVASSLNIPVFNLQRPDARARLTAFLKSKHPPDTL